MSNKPEETKIPTGRGIFQFTNLRIWRRSRREAGDISIDPQFRRNVVLMYINIVWTWLFRQYEHLRYDRQIKATPITNPPVFILGHWRSGTTLLHELMGKDPRFGYINTFQAVTFEFCIVGGRVLKPLLKRVAPPTRLIDNMAFSFDNPQEDEPAIGLLCPYSLYYQWLYPRNWRHYLRYAALDDVPKSVVDEWKRVYHFIVQKLTFMSNGKPIILKNPVHNARIPLLLEMFPNAKFIHIVRNPYMVYLSTQKMRPISFKLSQLQEMPDEAELDTALLETYKFFNQRCLDDLPKIPAENLIEVRYEDLERNPVSELRRIYEYLQLPDFAEVEATIQQEFASRANYQKTYLRISPEVIEKVKTHWSFALEQWGYSEYTLLEISQ